MSVLELNHVKKSFNNGTLHVLKDISLSVEKGEVVAIIGPSGSGKSTLLRCATLLERIDSGEVCFDGNYAARTGDDGAAVYADKAELKQIRNYFGLVFQQFNLFLAHAEPAKLAHRFLQPGEKFLAPRVALRGELDRKSVV